MSKRRKKRKRPNPKRVSFIQERTKVQKEDDVATLGYVEYEITDEPIHDRNYKELPVHVREQIEELYYMVHQNPSQAIAALEDLIQEYPRIPQLYNFLSVAYSGSGAHDKVEAIVKKAYEQNPHYLFAKCNYAEICLQKGEIQKIPQIFDNKFDLKLLYPERNRFHISEIVGFAAIMGLYFCAVDQIQTAELYYKILRELAPGHIMTNRLQLVLSPSVVVNELRKSPAGL